MQQKRKALKAMQRKFAALQERLKNELAALDTTEARVRHLDGLRKVISASSTKGRGAGAAPAVKAFCSRSLHLSHPVTGPWQSALPSASDSFLEMQLLALPAYYTRRK